MLVVGAGAGGGPTSPTRSPARSPTRIASSPPAGTGTTLRHRRASPRRPASFSPRRATGFLALRSLSTEERAGHHLRDAALRGDARGASRLLAAHAGAANRADNDGTTALHKAAQYNRLSILQALLASGANPDARGWEGRTALHEASLNGAVECVRELLLAQSDRTALDDSGRTPRDCATAIGSAAIVALLHDDSVLAEPEPEPEPEPKLQPASEPEPEPPSEPQPQLHNHQTGAAEARIGRTRRVHESRYLVDALLSPAAAATHPALEDQAVAKDPGAPTSPDGGGDVSSSVAGIELAPPPAEALATIRRLAGDYRAKTTSTSAPALLAASVDRWARVTDSPLRAQPTGLDDGAIRRWAAHGEARSG